MRYINWIISQKRSREMKSKKKINANNMIMNARAGKKEKYRGNWMILCGEEI
jgi:hypothetical protein